MSTLLVVQGPHMGVKYALEPVTTIGRGEENQICLADPNVSRNHCEIRTQGHVSTIVDKDSRNGVIVNGERVERKNLLRNDEIRIGSTVFLYDTDHDLKNTRFSNKRVYFASPTDETIVRLGEPDDAAAAAPASRDDRHVRSARDLVRQLGDLFAPDDEPLPEALKRILATLMSFFEAACGCLLTWDQASREFVPVVTISPNDAFAVSQKVIRTVLREKRAVLLDPGHDTAVLRDRLKMECGDSDAAPAALCLPLLRRDRVIGLLYLEVADEDQLLLQDVQLLQAVAHLTRTAIEHSETVDDLERRRERERRDESKRRLVGRSRAFVHVLELVDKVAGVNSTVLLTGETGTGKEMIAREIHARSPRANQPFVPVNCAAIPETLIESELFGHERGSFTGADRMRRGLIEEAHGGTLLLDEIGEMDFNTQTKLLRFLQEHVVTRVGGNQPIPVDVRVVASTNADLRRGVRDKTFREDLWYRLNVFEIHLPPLRERRPDIIPLVEFFMHLYATRYHRQVLGFEPESQHLLENYDWPGNIRELQNAVERAVLLCDDGVLRPDHFRLSLNAVPAAPGAPTSADPLAPLDEGQVMTLQEAEKRCIRAALDAADWNQAQAARDLEIHRNTLRKKIKDLGLEPPR